MDIRPAPDLTQGDITANAQATSILQPDPDAISIGLLYRKARSSIAASVRYLIEAGHRLKKKKDELGHGKWLSWVEANADVLGFGISAASKLMKAATKFVASYEYG